MLEVHLSVMRRFKNSLLHGQTLLHRIKLNGHNRAMRFHEHLHLPTIKRMNHEMIMSSTHEISMTLIRMLETSMIEIDTLTTNMQMIRMQINLRSNIGMMVTEMLVNKLLQIIGMSTRTHKMTMMMINYCINKFQGHHSSTQPTHHQRLKRHQYHTTINI